MTRFFLISLLIILSILLISCINNDSRVIRQQLFFRMDTMVEATISVPPRYNPTPLWRSMDSLLTQCEKRFSASGDSSEIKIINTRTSNALPISIQLGEILRMGIDYGDTLDGAFDITVLPLKELWGLCEQCGASDSAPIPMIQPPDSASVSAALRSVDYKKIRLNAAADSVFFDSDSTCVDVGGIAKGFVIKWLGALMKGRGVNDFLISAGGDIIAYGGKPDGAPWQVGVRHPRRPDALTAVIPVGYGAVFTSGDYERMRQDANGRRYHHIFDAKTGYPCGRNQSLTIQTHDPVTADILSTGLFCREPEDILDFINARPNTECIIVDSTGTKFMSARWVF